MSVQRQFFPDEEDEKGAAKALMRLQDTYKLDSESISKGRLPGKKSTWATVPAVPSTLTSILHASARCTMQWQIDIHANENCLHYAKQTS